MTRVSLLRQLPSSSPVPFLGQDASRPEDADPEGQASDDAPPSAGDRGRHLETKRFSRRRRSCREQDAVKRRWQEEVTSRLRYGSICAFICLQSSPGASKETQQSHLISPPQTRLGSVVVGPAEHDQWPMGRGCVIYSSVVVGLLA